MKSLVLIATIVAGLSLSSTTESFASCAGCLPGWRCHIPEDLGFHYGYCVPDSVIVHCLCVDTRGSPDAVTLFFGPCPQEPQGLDGLACMEIGVG